MYLEDLYRSLINILCQRVANGQLSERRLARLADISQPHVHNALKGTRSFSLSTCDQILRRLGMTVYDLLPTASGSPRTGCQRCSQDRFAIEVPIVQGRLGPGMPLPSAPDPFQTYPFHGAWVAALEGAVLVRLGPDPSMESLFQEDDLVLLDQARAARLHPHPRAFYVINRRGEGLLRRVWLGPSKGQLFASALSGVPELIPIWPAAEEHLLDVVRARVVWLGRYLPAA